MAPEELAAYIDRRWEKEVQAEPYRQAQQALDGTRETARALGDYYRNEHKYRSLFGVLVCIAALLGAPWPFMGFILCLELIRVGECLTSDTPARFERWLAEDANWLLP